MYRYLALNLLLFFNCSISNANNTDSNHPTTHTEQVSKLSNQDFCRLILKKYEQKDLESFNQMFADNVVIRDWKIRVEGKIQALNEFRKNFESVNTIKIDILAMYESNSAVAAELKITIDDKQIIYIVDVITITKEQKIASISSYIGRGDQDQ